MSEYNEFSDQLEIDIIGLENDYPAAIQLENLHFQTNLSSKKLVVDYGFFANKNLPTFIPDKLDALYTISPTPTATYNGTLGVNSVDYMIRLTERDPSQNIVSQHVIYVLWGNELSLPPPAYVLSSQQAFMLNNYYWSYSTTWFSQIITNTLLDVYNASGIFANDAVTQVVAGSSAFGLLVNINLFTNGANSVDIEFSSNLNKLFRFQSVKVDNLFEKLIFSPNQTTYAGESCFICNGTGWSTEWFPFNEIFIQSDLKLKKIQKQNNVKTTTSFYTTNYKNVILQFNITPPNPNEIYSYFEYITQSDNTKFIFFENDVDLTQDYTLVIYLYNIVKNVKFPYTLKKNEYINLKLRLFTKK